MRGPHLGRDVRRSTDTPDAAPPTKRYHASNSAANSPQHAEHEGERDPSTRECHGAVLSIVPSLRICGQHGVIFSARPHDRESFSFGGAVAMHDAGRHGLASSLDVNPATAPDSGRAPDRRPDRVGGGPPEPGGAMTGLGGLPVGLGGHGGGLLESPRPGLSPAVPSGSERSPRRGGGENARPSASLSSSQSASSVSTSLGDTYDETDGEKTQTL